jgi:hypothetical protein
VNMQLAYLLHFGKAPSPAPLGTASDHAGSVMRNNPQCFQRRINHMQVEAVASIP